jgi:phosphoserine phosphatase RsbU/P
MAADHDASVEQDLLTRRAKLEEAIASASDDSQLARLLQEVDSALERLKLGTYGLCETCHEPIEVERLDADPVIRFCLDHLPASQQHALEEDLGLAAQIQAGLLPPAGLRHAGWETAYFYKAAGVVSGDYCDLLSHDEGFHFIVGDVSGKGVSAAMLMAHLHATFRPLVSQGLALERIMERASRVFCESTHSTLFATLICGKADHAGTIAISNAGHDPALVAHGGELSRIGATGLPLGMFCNEQFSTTELRLNPGDCIFLYTDGLTEATDASGDEYGIERLCDSVMAHRGLPAHELIAACLADLTSFTSNTAMRDDLTMMAIRRVGA